ncbi:MAG: competence/damage-inducible protein A [Eubacterium sp.]|nr:competence/damage-inducible protein A [Eubacterium sp.]
MKCAIISVGTELLMGQIVDTNAAWLSERLRSLGIDVFYRYTVGDNPERLADTIRTAFDHVDLVISIGGLGPTEDDLTKETFCDVLGVPLVRDERTVQDLESNAKISQKVFTDNNYKQAMLPEGAVIFYNYTGTAPGFAKEVDGKIFICMPGPPRELSSIWENGAEDYLKGLGDGEVYYHVIRLFGKGESVIETDLIDLIDAQTDPTIATYAKEGECTVRVASKHKDPEEAKRKVDEMTEIICDRERDFVYSTDDEPLVMLVGRKLLEKGLSISCCESCTGGMFASQLTNVPGISSVFDRGLVTYTYNAKMNELGVREETLAKYTAVSRQVADEMVTGLQAKTGCDVCVSVTGIAGPSGGTKRKPVGLVYVGCIVKGKKKVVKLNISNLGRAWIRKYATLAMFNIINKMIDGSKIPPM